MIFWKDEYSVGIPEIDKQHKKLFEIGERIYYTASVDDGYDHYDEIRKFLDELADYTDFHFKYEEDLLSRYHYPELESQEIQHVFFVKKLKKLIAKDLEKGQYETILEIVGFVADWIGGHILKSDFAYRDYLINESGDGSLTHLKT